MSFSNNNDEEFTISVSSDGIDEDDVCLVWIKDGDKTGDTLFRIHDFSFEDMGSTIQIFLYDHTESSFEASGL